MQQELQKLYDNNDYNSTHAVELSKKITNDLKIISNIETLKSNIESYIDVLDSNDEELLKEVESEIPSLTKEINSLELETKLNGKNDSKNAIVEIHSGAGGTEACDWADMLYRMYLRYFDIKGFK